MSKFHYFLPVSCGRLSNDDLVDDVSFHIMVVMSGNALSPANHTQSISVLQSCLNSLHVWFCENGMALNPNKSVAIWFGTPQRLMIAVLA